MSKSMTKELEAKLIEAEARADEYYSLNEELLDKVEELEWNYGIAIKELEERAEEYYQLNEELLDKVEELTAARDAFEQMYLTAAYGSAALTGEDK